MSFFFHQLFIHSSPYRHRSQSTYLGDGANVGERRSLLAQLGLEGRHGLAHAVRQDELLPQFDVGSALGYVGGIGSWYKK